MTESYRKKLIEVALPLKAINDESALRKRKAPSGYPTTLHKWWAQRPLAACRAVLFASLVDDPDSDPTFLKPDGTVDEDRAGVKRAELFNLIEELILWQNSDNPRIINAARAEIARCVASRKIERGELTTDTIIFGSKIGQKHAKGPISGDGITAWEIVLMKARPEVVNAFLAGYAPPVLDPFAGGGSIPLEAQRLGLRAYASDLNPVPVLINKALIEIPPKFAGRPPVNPEWQAKLDAQKVATIWHGAQGLAEDIRYYGQWMRDEAEKRIGHLYPKVKITKEMAADRPDLKEYVGQELTVIAWLWARTVASPNPACSGAHVPLLRSFMLSTKTGKQAFAFPEINSSDNSFRFSVRVGSPPKGFDPKRGTVVRTGATCLLTGSPIPLEHIRSEAKAGRMRDTLLAIVVEGNSGRLYLSPTEDQSRVAANANPDGYPDTDMPEKALGFRVQLYGVDKHFKLFTRRQLAAHVLLSALADEMRTNVASHALTCSQDANAGASQQSMQGAKEYSDAIAFYLACALSRCLDYNSAFASWRPKDNAMRSTFAKQSLPMIWDFAEANPLEKSSAGFADCCRVIAKCVELLPAATESHAQQLDATASVTALKNSLVCTDPPYYDNIGYADLSDFFYIWLRKALSRVYPSLFATLLTPKVQELIATPYRHAGNRESAKAFFEKGFGSAFEKVRESASSEYPITVFYAFKQSETDESDEDDDEDVSASHSVASTGWETMLEGLIKARFCITGTWPMRTEGDNRQVGLGTNALASSIVLVCRSRPAAAPLATRKQFINSLRQELPEALRALQHGNIAPVDLAQAAIGPGMAVFTRYSKVVESDGSTMTVRTALGLINQTLDEVLAEQEGEFDGDTRWALTWFEQFGMDDGPFGDAETLSKAKNTAINALQEAGVIFAKGSIVRLVKRNELPEDWNPATDKRLTVWEVTQHLIRRLDQQGETGAAELVGQLGGIAEVARDLAYRLYSTCERKKWAQEALAYNSLVVAWPELTRLARSTQNRQTSTQQELFN